MQIFNRVRLRDFWADHERNEIALRAWFQLIRSHDWDSPEALNATFPNAEFEADLVAFGLNGSSLFLIATIDFGRMAIWIRDIQIHNEFATGEWKALAASEASSGEDYAALVETFPARPIRNDEQLHQAVARTDELLSISGRSEDEQDYLEVLSLLIEDYEHANVPIPSVSAAEIARLLVNEHGLTQAQIIPLLGNKQKAMALLSGTRPLDLRQGARCARYFKLPPETFADPDDLEIELPKSPRGRR